MYGNIMAISTISDILVIYYDNGQIELTRLFNSRNVSSMLNSVEFRPVSPSRIINCFKSPI